MTNEEKLEREFEELWQKYWDAPCNNITKYHCKHFYFQACRKRQEESDKLKEERERLSKLLIEANTRIVELEEDKLLEK